MRGHFDGKVCVVTGAASGIGYAVSDALLQRGAVVVLADRDTDRLASACDQLAAHRDGVVCPGNVVSRIFGTPIIGEAVEARSPEDAIPAEQAARTILDGVAAGEGIIAFPDGPKELWRQYWSAPEKVEGYLRDLAAHRREAFAARPSRPE